MDQLATDFAARILICGSRDYEDYEYLRSKTWEMYLTFFCDERAVLIHGGATGADSLAGIAGRSFGWPVIAVPANWERYGKAAGAIRNTEMLKYEPDLCLAFTSKRLTDSRGTLDMVSQAQQKGVMVIVF